MINERLVEIARAIAQYGGRAYIVGGWVRDFYMGRPSKDIDVEVFWMQPDVLARILNQFGSVNCVGESFEVLKLDNEFDFSIPRRDSKTGKGHKGFTIEGDPNMTLFEAARRRDFTINAIYYDPLDQQFIDPFQGRDDIDNRVLRMVDALTFGDDSLRVLRGVQFAARFGFDMDDATLQLCAGMDLSDLPSERVWGEFEKLLKSSRPSVGFELMRRIGLTATLFPELHALIGVQQDPEWHPEGDVWVHTLQVVDSARFLMDQDKDFAVSSKGEELAVMLGALCHDFGKPAFTKFEEGRWRARGHEEGGVEPARAFLDRLNVHTVDGYNVRAQVLALVENHLAPLAWFKDQPKKSAFRRLSHKVDLMLLARVSCADKMGRVTADSDSINLEAIDWFVSVVKSLDLQDGKPPAAILMGRHLLDVGFKPGPDMGRVLKAVYERQMDGTVTNLDEALAAAKELS